MNTFESIIECSIFHNIFKYIVFQRCQKALLWSKGLIICGFSWMVDMSFSSTCFPKPFHFHFPYLLALWLYYISTILVPVNATCDLASHYYSGYFDIFQNQFIGSHCPQQRYFEMPDPQKKRKVTSQIEITPLFKWNIIVLSFFIPKMCIYRSHSCHSFAS